MDSLPPASSAASLVQPGRIHRAAYVDPAIFEEEMRLIFGRSWLYLCHESQVAKPGSFYTTVMGREPVIVSRDSSGAAGSGGTGGAGGATMYPSSREP